MEPENLDITTHEGRVNVLKNIELQLQGENGRCETAEDTLAMRKIQEAVFWLTFAEDRK